MQVQFDHQVISSFLLFIDNKIQSIGQSYTNYSGLFYPVYTSIQNLYAYATPFKQLCNDTSISGATIISGIYLNGNYIGIGQSGLQAINHKDGIAYFNQQLPSSTIISGNYAIKEFNVELTDQPDWKLLFENKYITNNFYNQTLSGLSSDVKTSPILFIKHITEENKPFGFGGINNNVIRLRGVLITDNQYQKIGVCNILKNYNIYQLPITTTNIPFDMLGNYTGISYSYNALPSDPNYYCLINTVKAIDVPQRGEYASLVKSMALIDFELNTFIQNVR